MSPIFTSPKSGGQRGLINTLLQKTINKTRLSLIEGDITRQATDAIVNAANSSLMGGGGVDGAIHHAGGPAILDECKQIVSKIGRLPTGKAVITTGGNLSAKYVIHTVGPIWHGGKKNEPKLLAIAYRESLKVAVTNNLKTVSLPSISTGTYRYPVNLAAKTALQTVIDFLQSNNSLDEVRFILFDNPTYDAYEHALEDLIV